MVAPRYLLGARHVAAYIKEMSISEPREDFDDRLMLYNLCALNSYRYPLRQANSDRQAQRVSGLGTLGQLGTFERRVSLVQTTSSPEFSDRGICDRVKKTMRSLVAKYPQGLAGAEPIIKFR